MEWNILNYSTVEKAYRSVSIDHAEIIALGVGLGLIFAIFNIIKIVKQTSDKNIDVVMILNLLKEYSNILVMILFMPMAILLAEDIFALIETAYINQLGVKPKGDIWTEEKKEVHSAVLSLVERRKDSSYIEKLGYAIVTALETLVILSIKPFAVLIDNWSYGFALIYRFIFLGTLKMTGGLAIACYIYEPTRVYYFIWLKNLLICYLLIPGFLFVTVFVDLLRAQFWGKADIQLGIVILCVLIKLFGYGVVQKLLHKSL